MATATGSEVTQAAGCVDAERLSQVLREVAAELRALRETLEKRPSPEA